MYNSNLISFPTEKAPESNKKDLLAEYELMKQLQPHPNVIRLMGAVTLSGMPLCCRINKGTFRNLYKEYDCNMLGTHSVPRNLLIISDVRHNTRQSLVDGFVIKATKFNQRLYY